MKSRHVRKIHRIHKIQEQTVQDMKRGGILGIHRKLIFGTTDNS
jgi:hypothetical protein